MTPRETFRIVEPIRSTNSSARRVMTRRAPAFTVLTSEGPGTNRNPAMTTDVMKVSSPVPAVPATLTKLPPMGFNCGPTLANAAWKLVEASSHRL